MRICLLTQPGRGDTEPFVALAAGLKERGHLVTLGSRPDLAQLVRDHSIDFEPLGNPYQPFIQDAARAGAMGSGRPISKVRLGLRQKRYVTENLHEDVLEAAEGAELIIYKYPWVTAHTVAESLGIPSVPVMLLPLVRTTSWPSFMSGRGVDRGRLGNRLMWTLPWQAVWMALRFDDKKFRQRLGLPRLPWLAPSLLRTSEQTPVLCAWSDAVLPKPPDWPDGVLTTGYWFLDPPSDWQPSKEIVDFLAAGPPPLSIGFGSMASPDRQATFKVVLEALRITGHRAVVLSGWGDIGRGEQLPKHVFSTSDLPHSWLFPQVAAVVHHGGAGTTGATLRAGVPSVVTPLVADQPSWGRLVHSLGTAPAPIPFQQLTAKRLAAAINVATSDPAISPRAAQIGERVRAEDGVDRAIDLCLGYAQTAN